MRGGGGGEKEEEEKAAVPNAVISPLGFISGRRRKRKRKVVINDVKKVRDSLDRRSERRQFFRSTKDGTVWRQQEGAP